ncbi:hypothetical protein HDE_04500 [Halotydeus destructor]|nr:hypothetical protein HDE_04500 [Halotydeus destructor]
MLAVTCAQPTEKPTEKPRGNVFSWIGGGLKHIGGQALGGLGQLQKMGGQALGGVIEVAKATVAAGFERDAKSRDKVVSHVKELDQNEQDKNKKIMGEVN